jgi:bacillithiol biosynthesis cysteine-adding enzyme BshC
MATRQDTTLGEAMIREAIELRRLPWIRPLVADQTTRFDTVRTLFAGNPADPGAWRDTIRRVSAAHKQRDGIAAVIERQLVSRNAPQPALAAAGILRDPASVAVVTGQQAGVFGGPFYTLLKAVTAIQLARRVRDEYGTPAVPVFWVEAEDHDWDEVRTASVLDRDFELRTVALAPVAGAGLQPMSALPLSADVDQTIAMLEATLPQTEFSPAVIEALRRCYAPGVSVSRSCARWLDELLGAQGLVVFESSDTAAKPLVADLFAAELRSAGQTTRLVRDGGAAMSALGHAPQLDPSDDVVNLFYLDDNGRRPIKRDGDRFVIGGDTVRPQADLIAEAGSHPERFSPNVVMRPLVQDRLLPTACYVAGPAELAYQAQIGGVYEAFGMEAPLLQSRASITVLDSGCSRFLERHSLPFEALQPNDESTLNRLLEQQLPPSVDRLLQESLQYFTGQTNALRDAVAGIDPTLTGTVDTTASKIADTLKTLQNKIVQACKRKDETLRRQFVRARSLTFPGGAPQERVLNVAFFANRYGLDIGARLIDILPTDTSKHYLVQL